MSVHIYLYANVPGSFICNSQNSETQISINRQMDKQSVLHDIMEH
jgi:hypothetical protein